MFLRRLQGISSNAGSQPTAFPSPGRLESLTQTVNRFGTNPTDTTASTDTESKVNVGNVTKAF